ncbi:uncharacterized protein LOC115819469 [Chanos chanos]|uniref:Uncharacterized protein LOC115819469 n=1 Tax=Chanos chanos TaxID=29144 RepID=A0A6J2W627_CHACN|nr:uncharacterized protein LOC115819469 [Chanos chanos]
MGTSTSTVLVEKSYKDTIQNFHCYADDTQLYVSAKPDERHQLNKIEECLKDIRHWMLTNFLSLNSEKTEVLVLGTRAARSKLSDRIVTLDGLSFSSCAAVKDLGVIIDSSLSIEAHVDNITRLAFFHVRNINRIRNALSFKDAEKLVHAFITSRLDYCNALLSGCSNRCINKLQLVQNAAARVLTRTKRYDHITPILSTLHWLPVKSRIDYKILLLNYRALNGLAPQYLRELLVFYDPPRLLRSKGAGHLLVPRVVTATAGGRAFSYRAPQLWNSLPINVRDSVSMFKSRLKTYLFSQVLGVKDQCFQYVQRIFELDAMCQPREYILVDEAGFNLTTRRRRGQNIIGHCAVVEVPDQRGGNVTVCCNQ